MPLLDLCWVGIAVVQQRHVLAASGKWEGKSRHCGHVQHSRWLGIVPVDEVFVAPTNDQLQGHKLVSPPSDRGCMARSGKAQLTKQAARAHAAVM